ncbi:macrophage colony-stimulating factor 1 receptor [Colossoma macropomum]|uniref:macrophage colony-stimulating factor 1 receptor n=1 Tax=Colossoma macropomum TaxID=42526 RepID=UPI0018645E6A|nr:macrophage colony-stimulating factor 1 receptor [Colossoma macropomum]
MFLLIFILGLLSCQAQGWSQPVIRLNPEDVVGSDVVLNSGSPLVLICEGEGPVMWSPRLYKHKRYSKSSGNSCTFSVEKATVEFTGTYKCIDKNKRASNFSSVHVFVRDPNVLFVTPPSLRSVVKKEGEDAILPCLLTDPAATDVQLRMDNGTAPPAGMNMTFDPKRGMLIQNVHPGYNADYVCSVKIQGVEKVSIVFSINVIQRARFPPYVFLQSNEYVRIVGERLEISCSTHNPNFNYNVTWRHSSRALPPPKEKANSRGDGLAIVSTLTIPAVSLSDSGNITCTGINDAGVNSSATNLLVVEKPFLRLTAKLPPRLSHQGLSVDVAEGKDVELGVDIEAYPPLKFHGWKFPNASQPEIPPLFRNNHRYEARLILKRLNSREQGEYTFHANSSKANASITFRIQMYQKPVVVLRQTNGSSVTCTAWGYPAPSILWYQCTGTRPTCMENSTLETPQPIPAETVEVQRKEFGEVEVESALAITPSDQTMTVECVAVNVAGQGSDTFPIEKSEKLFTEALTGAIGVMAFLLLLIIFLLYKYKQKPRYEIRWKIIEATDGNNYTFIDPTQLPYNEKLEFPRDKLKLGKILGAGAFGKVVEATAYGLGKEDNVTRVAVKMLKASAHSDEKEALMSELKILSHLGHHKNIVNLLGACTYGGPVLVITEYCCHGDLLNFLRSKTETFLNCVMTVPGIMEERSDYKNVTSERMFIRSDSGISSTCSENYLDMRPVGPRTNSTQVSSCGDQLADSWPLDIDDLLRFSYQVAQGLEFLAAKNCIHRDVAARNVLLADGRVAKICDFGLARDIMNDSNYVVKGNARLPVKWMAPESIFDCVYTVQSDVWSYGILLWEIFSLGKSPYPNILVDSKFYKMIKCGYQMSRPDFAPPEIYTIMQMCWNLEPTERPTFSKIGQLIERLLGDTPELYQNVQSGDQVLDEQQLEACDPAKANEESCEQEEEEQPLMNANNYQFC